QGSRLRRGAALRVAQGDHGGEEEADRRHHAAGARRHRRAARQGDDARSAAGAQGGHQGAVGRRARAEAPQRSEGDLMGNVLVVVETQEGHVRTATLPAITFGKQMAEKAGGKLSLLVVGAGVDGAAGEAAKYGAAEVLVADHPGLQHYLAETYAPIVAKVAKEKGASVVG